MNKDKKWKKDGKTERQKEKETKMRKLSDLDDVDERSWSPMRGALDDGEDDSRNSVSLLKRKEN